MKVKGILITVIFLLVLGCSTNDYSKTPEDAVKKTDREIAEVIYKEPAKEGLVLFFSKEIANGTSLAAGYIEKSILGWKWIYGGEHSNYSYQYFPSVKGTPFPMIFGEITNKKVNQIIIEDVKTKSKYTSKITKNNNHRIWFVFLDESHSLFLKVISKSEKGDIINTEWVNF